MSTRQAKKVRQQIRKHEERLISNFRDQVNQMPLWDRARLAVRVLTRNFNR